MGMLFSRRKEKNKGMTTTENLLQKERKILANVIPKKEDNVPKNTQQVKSEVEKTTPQHKFKN